MLSKRYLHILLLIFFVVASLFVCFYRLGASYLDDWDESWYAEITKQMLRTGEFFVSQWNGGYMFDKPPLYMWFTAFLSVFLGLNEFSIRFTSALAGALTLLLTSTYVYKKWGVVPSLLAFLTLAVNDTFIWRVRSGNVDGLVTFLILLTFFATSSKNHYRYVWLGILFTLIFLTKASLVFFPVVAFGIYEIVSFKQDILKQWKGYITVFLIFSLSIGTWLTIGTSKAGYDFLAYFLFKSDQGVSNISLIYAKTEYIKYMIYSLQRYFIVPLFIGVFFILLNIRKKEYVLILIYSFFLVIMLSFTERNNNWYLLPAMPFWSIIIGYATYTLIQSSGKFSYVTIVLILLPSLYLTQKNTRGHIFPIFYTSSSATHTETSILINKISDKENIVVRLDRLYPSTVYYSDRKVLSSQPGDSTNWVYLSRIDLDKRFHDGRTYWIAGKKKDVTDFATQYHLIDRVKSVNNEEAILKIDATVLQ